MTQQPTFHIQFNGEPVIDKAFVANVAEANLRSNVVPHTTRHTGITWLAIEGVDPYEICRYAGITMEMFEEVYAHHHPNFMTGVHRGFSWHRARLEPDKIPNWESQANVTSFSRITR